MKLNDVKCLLKDNVSNELKIHYGDADVAYVETVVNNWFNDDHNYDGRWQVITERVQNVGKVLDMAAGCGTFVLYGLRNGYDVWGVEPEGWKRQYFEEKIEASGYPALFKNRLIDSIGESLPFENGTFDLITTYQTLEHVGDVEKCIREMMRVLKPGGVLYIRAPDYRSFYEPHYRLPFLPKMNKKFAALYLTLLKRPLSGLQSLNWITEKSIVKILRSKDFNVGIERTGRFYYLKSREKIRQRLPLFTQKNLLISAIISVYDIRNKLSHVSRIGREEKVIDLWVRKIS